LLPEWTFFSGLDGETMHAEIIAIGDELASGQRLDTNSRWLSERLGELGIRVLYHTTVADDLPADVAVLRAAINRADVIVTTGGLGPTADDLTRQAIAEAIGVELTMNESALAHIRGLFARRKRDMPEKNVVQAMFPVGSRVIPNPHGTAPGIDMRIDRSGCPPARLFALPGVPAEMRGMWQETVVPALLESLGEKRRVICHRRIQCFGAGESHVEAMLPDLVRRGRMPSVGITASKATITLRVTAEAESAEACEAIMAPTIATIREKLGTLVFGEEDDELQHAVVRLLRERKRTLATAEHGAGGLIAHWLGELADATDVYRGSLVAASPAGLADGLGLSATAEAGSDDFIKQTAVALRERFNGDLGLAAGVASGSEASDDQLRQFIMALADGSGVSVKTSPYAAHPDILHQLAAKQALNFVRLALL